MTIVAHPNSLLSEDYPTPVSTGVARDDSLASDLTQREANGQAWQQVIDSKLVEWGRHPERLEEDDLIPPTPLALRVAVELAIKRRDGCHVPPMRVVPDRDGGIAFERSEGDWTTTIIVSSSGTMEILHWSGSKIVRVQQFG